MTDQTVLVAIDIGTTKVCVLIGEVGGRSGGVDVIGIGQAPSDGLRKGVVIDIDRTVQSVAAAVDAAPENAALWREYRAAVTVLMEAGADGDADDDTKAFLLAIRTPVRPAMGNGKKS